MADVLPAPGEHMAGHFADLSAQGGIALETDRPGPAPQQRPAAAAQPHLTFELRPAGVAAVAETDPRGAASDVGPSEETSAAAAADGSRGGVGPAEQQARGVSGTEGRSREAGGRQTDSGTRRSLPQSMQSLWDATWRRVHGRGVLEAPEVPEPVGHPASSAKHQPTLFGLATRP
jgi:hypothetical protein